MFILAGVRDDFVGSNGFHFHKHLIWANTHKNTRKYPYLRVRINLIGGIWLLAVIKPITSGATFAELTDFFQI